MSLLINFWCENKLKNWYKKARGPSSPIMTDYDSYSEDPYAYKPSVNDKGDGKGDKLTTPGDTSSEGIGSGLGADYYTNSTGNNNQKLTQGPPKGYSAVNDPSAQFPLDSDSDSFGMPNVDNRNIDKGDYEGVSDDGLMGDNQEEGIGIGLNNVINNKLDHKKDPIGIFNQNKAKRTVFDRVKEMAR